MKISLQKGLSLVEVVVGSAIITIAIVILVNSFGFFINASLANMNRVQAAFLLEESLEAMRLIKDQDWDSVLALATTTDYYLAFSGGSWSATTSPSYQTVDASFERTIRLYDVYRDENGDSVSSGTYDAGIKRVIATVAWQYGASTSTKTLSTFISNVMSN